MRLMEPLPLIEVVVALHEGGSVEYHTRSFAGGPASEDDIKRLLMCVVRGMTTNPEPPPLFAEEPS